MAHDGQDMTQMTTPAILPDLLTLTRAAVPAVEAVFERARESVRTMVTADGRISGALIEANQTAAHGLAWLATYNQSLQQMQRWAEALEADGKFGEVEQLLHQIAFGEYLHQVAGGIPMNQGEVVRLQDMGLGWDALSGFQCAEVQTLMAQANSQAARSRLVALMEDQAGATMFGASGLDEELEMIRDQFRRYAQEKVEPNAHDWHLKDELIPIEIIEELAEMGVFGLTIPEEFGGFGLSKASMCVVSEELVARLYRCGFTGHAVRDRGRADHRGRHGRAERPTGCRNWPALKFCQPPCSLSPTPDRTLAACAPVRSRTKTAITRSPATRHGSPTRRAPM